MTADGKGSGQGRGGGRGGGRGHGQGGSGGRGCGRGEVVEEVERGEVLEEVVDGREVVVHGGPATTSGRGRGRSAGKSRGGKRAEPSSLPWQPVDPGKDTIPSPLSFCVDVSR